MTRFKKTMWMNVAGAFGWALVGIALLINQHQRGIRMHWLVAVMYLVLIAVPAFTARALSHLGGQVADLYVVNLGLKTYCAACATRSSAIVSLAGPFSWS